MADVSKIKGTDNTVYNIKDATARGVTDTLNVITLTGSTSGTITQEQVNSINKNTLIEWKRTSNTSPEYLRYRYITSTGYMFTNLAHATKTPVATMFSINTSSLTWSVSEIVIQPYINGGASTITSNNLTASRALVSNSDGKVEASTATAADLSILNKLLFKSTKAYAVGDVCLFSGKLFVCATAKTATQTSSAYSPSTSGDTTYWTRVFIS